MRRAALAVLGVSFVCVMFGACAPSQRSETKPMGDSRQPVEPTSDPKQAFERNCSVCHSLELPMAQRLDRANWEAVVDDMVEKFGAKWIVGEERRIIIDYLVENYGPDRPRSSDGRR